MDTNCTIIIPVYNVFAEAADCLQSVLKHTPEEVPVLVIDDASPDGDFRAFLPQEFAGAPQLTLLRNERNLGYAATCNLGIGRAAGRDVVLLNSDTEVTKSWLQNMREAAYSRAGVATVTPFTNNGIICSLPNFCRDNVIPCGLALDELAEIVREVSRREYPELPTCVGFCVYIRREALDAVGAFDAETFGRGYGEENDFSCRARAAGFVDLLDDASYVYHKGNASFEGLKGELEKRNGELLRQRYPHYFDEVSRFCSRDPLRSIRLRVLDRLVEKWNDERRRVLHVLQNGPIEPRGEALGGTELHVQDLIEKETSAAHWSLVPGRGFWYLTAHFPGGGREYILPSTSTGLPQIINRRYFDLVHLQHPRRFALSELSEALRRHGNYVVSLHDFSLACPRFHLCTPAYEHCSGRECRECCGYNDKFMDGYRREGARLLAGARRVICFSESSRKLMERVLGLEFCSEQRRHGIPGALPERAFPPPEKPGQLPQVSLKAVFLGYLAPHKGSHLIGQLARHRVLPGGIPVEWHVIGKMVGSSPAGIIEHGEYQRLELQGRLRALNPHVVIILSRCPETYCLTLDEAWNAGIPAIVTPLGAPAERVAATGAGWILPRLDEASVLECLEGITGDWESYLRVHARALSAGIVSRAEAAESYGRLYSALFDSEYCSDFLGLRSYLADSAAESPPRPSLAMRAAAKVINKIIYELDRIGVRQKIQSFAKQIIPLRVIEALKSAR